MSLSFKSHSPGLRLTPVCQHTFLNIILGVIPDGETQVFECRTWTWGSTTPGRLLAAWKRKHPVLAASFIRAYENPKARPDQTHEQARAAKIVERPRKVGYRVNSAA